jgi:hypothetical protein
MLTHRTAYTALSAIHTLGAMALVVAGDFVHAAIALLAASVYAGLVPRRPDDRE